jgi:hypothetical protein
MKTVLSTFDEELAQRIQLRLADQGIRSAMRTGSEDGLDMFILEVSEEDYESASPQVEAIIEEISPSHPPTPCPNCGSVQIKNGPPEEDEGVSSMGYQKICGECGYEWLQPW